ncbi:hypothetical protein SUGI_0185780 [Cryptomeria japonica]|nr:hypothetical protein SUGI_0185780 [Cryptomeria japonica]
MGFLKGAVTMLLLLSALMAALVSAGNGRESRFLLTATNSKKVDCSYNHYVCGKCKNKCKYPSVCCDGKCTDIGSDRFNCGKCGVTCKKGSYCAYSLCSYA